MHVVTAGQHPEGLRHGSERVVPSARQEQEPLRGVPKSQDVVAELTCGSTAPIRNQPAVQEFGE